LLQIAGNLPFTCYYEARGPFGRASPRDVKRFILRRSDNKCNYSESEGPFGRASPWDVERFFLGGEELRPSAAIPRPQPLHDSGSQKD